RKSATLCVWQHQVVSPSSAELVADVTSLSLAFLHSHPAAADIYPLSLHDALPIFPGAPAALHYDAKGSGRTWTVCDVLAVDGSKDRKSTRLNSSHVKNSYAVFCLKKKNTHGPGWGAASPRYSLQTTTRTR